MKNFIILYHLGINELQAKASCAEYWTGTENDLQMEFCQEDACCSTKNLDVPGGHNCTSKSFYGSSLGSCADFQFVSGPVQGRVFQPRIFPIQSCKPMLSLTQFPLRGDHSVSLHIQIISFQIRMELCS